MKKITLTYCPSSVEKNRICGHTFEVIDYFLLFYNLNYNVEIIIQESIDKHFIFEAWEDKYILPKDYKKFIKFKPNTKKIISDVLIITSGLNENYLNKVKLIYKKLILFRCNPNIEYKQLLNNRIILLNDFRVYRDNIGNHYVKKIFFRNFKKINTSENKILIYLNTNLRKIDEVNTNKNYLYVSGDDHPNKNILKAPVKNLFSKFDTFLYTKTSRQFDCSPRLLAECYFYNKKIIFDFNFSEYCGQNYGDTGLFWRMFDIVSNFSSLILTEEDDILKYI